MPDKTEYCEGDELDTTGLTLTATYSDGSTRAIDGGFVCSGFDSSTPGQKTVTVLFEGKTATFDVSVLEPAVRIRGFVPFKKVDYRTTITFSADVANPVSGAEVHWFIDGKDKGAAESYTEKEAKQTFTVQAKYMKGSTILAESAVETVNVKTGFFDRLISFILCLIGRCPKVVQAYLGVEFFGKKPA